MTKRVTVGELNVDAELYTFINEEALPGTGIETGEFWDKFEQIISEMVPRNRKLVHKRESIQKQIDQWYKDHNGSEYELEEYKSFLGEIGYLVPEGGKFSVETANVDPEISMVAGPQLVVPIMNARYALNAANARWGSLYDALYGTDVIAEDDGAEKGSSYNPKRGEKVVAWARGFLDSSVPINGSWENITGLSVADGELILTLGDGTSTGLINPAQFVGYQGSEAAPSSVLVKRNGLHIDIIVDKEHPIGSSDKASIADVVLESAVTAICDCEDSVAAVDGEDKVVAYRNWLGLMKGDLEETFDKGGRTIRRNLNPDRIYENGDGNSVTLAGRSLLLVRNVGLLMTNPAITLKDGSEVTEDRNGWRGYLDDCLHDIGANGKHGNSREGSVYIVKPKMHGPEEVAYSCDLFSRVEKALA